MAGRRTEQESEQTRLDVYRLRDLHGLSYNQIARMLGTTKSMVQYYLSTREKTEKNATKAEVMALW